MINATLQSRFNHAAQLFADQKFQDSLEAYQNIFAPENETEFDTPSETFCLEVRLRIAFCLIELQQYEEARFEFETQSTKNLLAYAGPAQREAYFFSFGNLLGKIGHFEEADILLAQAQNIATEELKDSSTVDRVCRFRLHWANHSANWSQLMELAQNFRALAQTHQLWALMHWSTEAMCFALRGLHQYAEAKQGAEFICQRLQQTGARPEHIAVWQNFITELSA